ncbi:hypothetical protein CVS40_11738 [Lucilia cuprina]|nr:hypothetical protein CVS40_11738 [Lucilia cuprina]
MKNPGAQRQKTAKRFVKYNANNPNKMDFGTILKDHLKTFHGTANVDHPGTPAVVVGPCTDVCVRI